MNYYHGVACQWAWLSGHRRAQYQTSCTRPLNRASYDGAAAGQHLLMLSDFGFNFSISVMPVAYLKSKVAADSHFS